LADVSDLSLKLPILAVTRLKFTADLERPLQLPAHAGALLRGVFGAALRQGACTMGLPRCSDCPLLRSCAYPSIFETPTRPEQFALRYSQLPNPYIIEPPPGPAALRSGEPLKFSMVLVGEATQGQLPLIVNAWQRALRSGIGRSRVSGRLQSVDAVDSRGQVTKAFDLGAFCSLGELPALDLAALMPVGSSVPSHLHITFGSPLRLQHDAKPLSPEQLTPRVFMSHLLRRLSLVLELHLGVTLPFDMAGLLSEAERITHDKSQLKWRELRRYSARQNQELPQGGVLGVWSWSGSLVTLLPWLLLGQWFHVGKGATAGLGGYTLKVGAV
jgi:hypothetical protein